MTIYGPLPKTTLNRKLNGTALDESFDSHKAAIEENKHPYLIEPSHFEEITAKYHAVRLKDPHY